MDYFKTLANKVLDTWAAYDYDWDAFADVAAASLTEIPIHEHLDVDELMNRYFSCKPGYFPVQNHPAPEIVAAYRNSKFHIMVHLWADLIGNPHQHGWPGAFQVWRGNPLHAVYEFSETQRINDVLQFGRLRVQRLEQLKPGDAIPIYVGGAYIHGLSHVQRPSFSISIRSNHTDDRMTRDFWRDGLSVVTNYANNEATLNARYRWLDFVRKSGQEDKYIYLTRKLITECDKTTVFFILQHINANLPEEFEKFLTLCEQRYGDAEFIGKMVSALADMDRTNIFMGAREGINNEDLRLFLAILYFTENRQEIVSVVKDILGSDDVEQIICNWALELLKFSNTHQNGEQADLSEGSEEIYKVLARGGSFDQFIARLKTIFDEKDIQTQTAQLKNVYTQHCQSPILTPLFVH